MAMTNCVTIDDHDRHGGVTPTLEGVITPCVTGEIGLELVA